MSVKLIAVPDIGIVNFYRRRGTKTMRISITNEGEVKVTMPMWAPYKVGLTFVRSHVQWIHEHANRNISILTNNSRIGKAHIITFVPNESIQKPSSRLSGNQIIIQVPRGVSVSSETIQAIAKKAGLRALRKESEQLLPVRLQELASQHGFSYRSVKIKQLKSRWGSCNSLGDITLNFYLMQLPWNIIDYVILHELTHTKVLAHGKPFWSELKKYCPDAYKLRKEVNTYRPTLQANQLT